jgi:DNA-binding transcriptional regulator PaaX
MRRGELIQKILYTLLISGAILIVLSAPSGTRRFLKQLPRELKKYRRARLLRALDRLRAQNRVKYVKEENGKIIIQATKNGRDYLEKVDFDNLSLECPNVWDKKWRLVIFDVPEKKKPAREALRNKLKDMGFKKLQHSIWATPFPCEKEINLVKLVFNLSDWWLDVIITENLGKREYQFRKHFDLL